MNGAELRSASVAQPDAGRVSIVSDTYRARRSRNQNGPRLWSKTQPQHVPNGEALSIRSRAPLQTQRAAAHRAAVRKIVALRDALDRYL